MRISDWSSDVCSSDLHSTPAGRELILDACPEPDILVATCSPPPYTPDWRGITSEDWRSGIETGLLSPIEFTNAVVGDMIARGWGRIEIGRAHACTPVTNAQLLSRLLPAKQHHP